MNTLQSEQCGESQVNVLVLEDNDRFAEELQAKLKAIGVGAVVADHVDEGLRMHNEQGPFTRVLSDMSTPIHGSPDAFCSTHEAGPLFRESLMEAGMDSEHIHLMSATVSPSDHREAERYGIPIESIHEKASLTRVSLSQILGIETVRTYTDLIPEAERTLPLTPRKLRVLQLAHGKNAVAALDDLRNYFSSYRPADAAECLAYFRSMQQAVRQLSNGEAPSAEMLPVLRALTRTEFMEQFGEETERAYLSLLLNSGTPSLIQLMQELLTHLEQFGTTHVTFLEQCAEQYNDSDDVRKQKLSDSFLEELYPQVFSSSLGSSLTQFGSAREALEEQIAADSITEVLSLLREASTGWWPSEVQFPAGDVLDLEENRDDDPEDRACDVLEAVNTYLSEQVCTALNIVES